MQRLADYEGLALFVKVTEQGSISAAGRLLGLPKSTVSKRLSALEARLGVRLVNRTTRRLSLTDAGRSLLERASRVVHEVESIETEVAARTGRPEGRVRIASPVGFGHAVLLPLVRSFLDLYPAVSLEMSFLDRRIDLVAERFDLAVQYGDIADTSHHARRVMDYKRLLVASPAYLAGAPPTLPATARSCSISTTTTGRSSRTATRSASGSARASLSRTCSAFIAPRSKAWALP